MRRTDTLFSIYIRNRDKWTCQRCHTKYDPPTNGLHNSHFWGRAKECTRFEPDNCIALCFGCHRLWGHGDERPAYEKFMKKKLGEKRFKSLMFQANNGLKKCKDDKLSLIYIKQLLREQVLIDFR